MLLLLTMSVAVAQTDKGSVAQQIDALERQRFNAQVSKDFAFLEKVFADDLIYTHSSGKVDNKTNYINSIREGKSVYEKIDVENISVRSYSNDQTAAVNGTVLINLGAADGKPNIVHLRYAVLYVKDPKKGWQLVSWQSTKIAS